MAEHDLAQGQEPNSPQGEETPQTEYYKAFTKDEYRDHQDKFYRGAYNEGKNKAFKDLTNELGIEAESFDDLLGKLKQPKQESKKSQGEVEELRDMVQKYQTEAQEYRSMLDEQRRTARIETAASKAFSALDGDLTIGADDVLSLYFANNSVVEDNGSFYTEIDGKPELDENGNRKSLENSILDFVQSKGFVKSSAQGTGGATGGGAPMTKPKRSDYQAALRSKNNALADKIWGMRKKAGGWADE